MTQTNRQRHEHSRLVAMGHGIMQTRSIWRRHVMLMLHRGDPFNLGFHNLPSEHVANACSIIYEPIFPELWWTDAVKRATNVCLISPYMIAIGEYDTTFDGKKQEPNPKRRSLPCTPPPGSHDPFFQSLSRGGSPAGRSKMSNEADGVTLLRALCFSSIRL